MKMPMKLSDVGQLGKLVEEYRHARCAVSYIRNAFTRPEAEQWLDPMEAMCLALEKAAQASKRRSLE